MTKRSYGQYCGLVRALELVGERWALLIVRDLLVSPKRFTDLRTGLPRIPTNILSARLKELEASGLIRRRVLPRPAGGVVYELTDLGHDLEVPVIHLSRWGARQLGEPGAEESVTVDSMVMALRSTFRAEAAEGVPLTAELRMGPIVLAARVADGTLLVTPGAAADPELVVEAGPAIRALMAGETTATDAVATGQIRLHRGDIELLDRFARIFRIGKDAAPGGA